MLLGSLLSLGALGSIELSAAKSRFSKPSASTGPMLVLRSAAHDQYGGQVVRICHNGYVILVSRTALPAHLRHGDTPGACSSVAGKDDVRGVEGLQAGTTLSSTGLNLAATTVLALLFFFLGFLLRRRASRTRL